MNLTSLSLSSSPRQGMECAPAQCRFVWRVCPLQNGKFRPRAQRHLRAPVRRRTLTDAPATRVRGGGAPKGATTVSRLSTGRALAIGRVAFRRSTCGDFCPRRPCFLAGSLESLAGLSTWAAPATLRVPRIQPLKAARHSAGGRLAGASRVRGYEPRPQAPPLPHVQRASAERPSLGEGMRTI